MNSLRLDWTLLQAFAAVAEAGSLSAAARATGTSQPTLGRHIRRLEDQAGAELFARHRGGLALTDAGRALLPAVHEMTAASARAALAAAGRSDGLSGTIRITTSVVFAQYHMPRIVARLRAEAPRVQVDLVASDSSDNLLFREADIAVRMYRPEQLDMVTRRLGDMTLGIYASRAWLERIGLPEGPERLEQVDFLGYDRSELILRGMRALGYDVSREDFPVRCDDQSAYFQMLRAGCGAGIAQTVIADAMPDLQRILPDVPLPRLPVWLTVPTALRDTPRVRFAWDILAEELKRLVVPAGAVS